MRPTWVGSGRALTQHQHLGPVLFPAHNALSLQLGMNCLFDLGAGAVVERDDQRAFREPRPTQA